MSNELTKLIDWKVKYVDKNPEKIHPEFLSEFSQTFINNFTCDFDTPYRRDLIYVAEKIALRLWQDANFQEVQGNVFSDGLLGFFDKINDKIVFLKSKLLFPISENLFR